MKRKWSWITLIGIGVLGAPAFGAIPARPGAVNYIEGAAYLNGTQLNSHDVGNATLTAGEELSTKTGKAEILLTPGVYLRLDDHSEVKMVSPDLTLTQVELERGRVGVEVDQILPQNNLQIIDAGVSTQLVKDGYYEFNANPATAEVFEGKAAVEVRDGKSKVVKSNREFNLVADTGGKPLAKEKPADFNSKASEANDDLYNWSSLRSEYLAENNDQIAGDYAFGNGFNPGWYWDPYAWDYTYIGVDPFFSPFGWGFYGPWGGGFYPGFYDGFYGGGYYHHGFGYHGHGGVHPIGPGGYRGGGMRAFHGGEGFHGGGFAGSGFHGGSFGGGGFHGGGGMGHGR